MENNIDNNLNNVGLGDTNSQSSNTFVSMDDFNPVYSLTEKELVENFVKSALIKADVPLKSDLLPEEMILKRKILNTIFSVLVFVYVSLIFFHFHVVVYAIGLIMLVLFFKLMRNYKIYKYVEKQVIARPNEKVSNIIMSIKPSLKENNSKKIFRISMAIAIILPLIIFFKPRIFYEKMDNGYGVRFYTFGLTNFTTANIPEKYKGENVVSLRGNTFSNMDFLKEVILPDTITEIRGQAFKNDVALKNVNIPNKLKYLGGGAFYNCKSITEINLPDTLTYIGGEAFYNCRLLKNIKLSNRLSEIRGNTFEECVSLETIDIPDSVVRIGAHAFYGCYNLSNVNVSETSNLDEIGSSAFRRCEILLKITLPKGVYINSRAFKESPTKISYYGGNDD